jgi:hypothetical protein
LRTFNANADEFREESEGRGAQDDQGRLSCSGRKWKVSEREAMPADIGTPILS